MGMQAAGMYPSFASWLYSNGGRMVDFKTGEVFINDAKAVEALQFYGDLITKYKLVPPEAMTWQFEEIVAGGQRDRYAMVQMFAPYGTLINDPKISTTGGNGRGSPCPDRTTSDEGRTWIDGHTLGVPKYTRNKEWALEFIAHVLLARLAEEGDGAWQRAAAALGAAGPRDGGEDRLAAGGGAGAGDRRADARPSGLGHAGAADALRHRTGCRPARRPRRVRWTSWRRDWQRSLRRAGIGRG